LRKQYVSQVDTNVHLQASALEQLYVNPQTGIAMWVADSGNSGHHNVSVMPRRNDHGPMDISVTVNGQARDWMVDGQSVMAGKSNQNGFSQPMVSEWYRHLR
jgi:hypothetical protein